MMLLILASRKASSACNTLVLAPHIFPNFVWLEASCQVASNFGARRGQGLAHVAPWWVHLFEEVFVGYCPKQSKLSDGRFTSVVREVRLLSKAQQVPQRVHPHHGVTVVLCFTGGLICLFAGAFLTDTLECVCKSCRVLHTLGLLEMLAKRSTVQF